MARQQHLWIFSSVLCCDAILEDNLLLNTDQTQTNLPIDEIFSDNKLVVIDHYILLLLLLVSKSLCEMSSHRSKENKVDYRHHCCYRQAIHLV